MKILRTLQWVPVVGFFVCPYVYAVDYENSAIKNHFLLSSFCQSISVFIIMIIVAFNL
jgi:hypothetical protein